MPRPKKEGAAEPKKRSRNGCWPCKARKVKCGEEKPHCLNCERQGETCDYSIRLNWGGRTKRQSDEMSIGPSPSVTVSSDLRPSVAAEVPPLPARPKEVIPYDTSRHGRSQSTASIPDWYPRRVDPGARRTSTDQPSTSIDAHYGNAELGTRNTISDTYMRHGYEPLRGFPSAILDPRLQDAQFRNIVDYPSPSVSSLDSLGYGSPGDVSGYGAVTLQAPQASIRSPSERGTTLESPGRTNELDANSSPLLGHRHKRMKLSTADGFPRCSNATESDNPFDLPYSSDLSTRMRDLQNIHAGPGTPSSPLLSISRTLGSFETPAHSLARDLQETMVARYQSVRDARRVPVDFLLSGSTNEGTGSLSDFRAPGQTGSLKNGEDDATLYGYDLGRPDLDTRNDDLNCITIFTPPSTYRSMAFEPNDAFSTRDSWAACPKDAAFELGGYYSNPVPIKIPKSLEPLPSMLLENRMNLLYFHHFLNHTARILQPHDCEENPFRKLLPQMAVANEDLLNLLLSFSASHRARLLSHPVPVHRIAHWVQDIFPKLRQALSDSSSPTSTDTLTTAIMLASLEIIAPNTFEVEVSWKEHLTVARELIKARGGLQSVLRNDVAHFISRWFAYLDVIGSLSGSRNDRPLSSDYWSSEDLNSDNEYEIDCLLGFTSRLIKILASIAELAKQCEGERIENGKVRDDWRPSDEVAEKARKLEADLQESRLHVYRGCMHRSSSHDYSEDDWDSREVYATNEAFHWAGYIHLSQRVLGKPISDPDVQNAVREIVGALYKVRHGGSAEACLLFPMFTAGCYAVDQDSKGKIMERLKSVEGFGLTHVHKARKLMQKVWETGKPWESLVSDEFFG